MVLDPAASAAHDAVLQRAWRRHRVGRRVIDVLPLVVMGLLAAASWWLVTRSTAPDAGRTGGPARHEPDYTMQRFNVQRYDRTGRLKADIAGDVLRHYPDDDTYEVDNVRMTATMPDGHTLDGSALRSISNADGSNIQLIGSAHVQRLATDTEEAVDFRSDFLDVALDTERLRSHLPVRLTRGSTTTIDAASMDYDNVSRVAHLQGRVKANFAATGPARRSPSRAATHAPAAATPR